ncbi:MAG: SDR family NAD(P)-dependent oxidoreductase, partial [Chromatiales bacterium]|nr:SDR family NAD(P)-dependent oxidoreductase [Chromatiales bacterium]
MKDKVAAVTASSLGLGQAIAKELAQEGARVGICARRQGPLEETKAAIESAGGEAFSCVADMSRRDDVERFVNDTAAHFGRLDILVNNAGDAAVGRTIEDSDEVWEQTYDINLWSAVRATRAAVPLIREQGGGSIVNVASVSGHSGLGGMADYNSAKAAMLAMTKTL